MVVPLLAKFHANVFGKETEDDPRSRILLTHVGDLNGVPGPSSSSA